MKLASIVPMKNVDLTFKGSYAMILAHLAKYYVGVKRNKNCYTIMDNSLIELGSAVTLDQILDAAAICKPDEIILPDVFCDGVATLTKVKECINELKRKGLIGKYRLMVVCQGKDQAEFFRTFIELKDIPEVDCIGIPKVAEKIFKDRGGRPFIERFLVFTTKEIHLLGCWTNLNEVKQYKNPQRIRSIDTCIPALLSQTTNDAFFDRPEKTIDLINDEINKLNYYSILEQLREEEDLL